MLRCSLVFFGGKKVGFLIGMVAVGANLGILKANQLANPRHLNRHLMTGPLKHTVH